ncbi:MAG: helix-turn-helix domain-containing protein [Treponema sp.]|nr:helix-turn-helix domain-containing protein [Treponema sp.]
MQEEKSETAGTERQVLFPAIMSIGEAAAYLTISKYFLYTLVKGGFVPYAKIGKRIVFRQQDLFEWIGKNVIEPEHSMMCEVEDDFEK